MTMTAEAAGCACGGVAGCRKESEGRGGGKQGMERLGGGDGRKNPPWGCRGVEEFGRPRRESHTLFASPLRLCRAARPPFCRHLPLWRGWQPRRGGDVLVVRALSPHPRGVLCCARARTASTPSCTERGRRGGAEVWRWRRQPAWAACSRPRPRRGAQRAQAAAVRAGSRGERGAGGRGERPRESTLGGGGLVGVGHRERAGLELELGGATGGCHGGLRPCRPPPPGQQCQAPT